MSRKELRDFIMSHEMRYLVTQSGDQVRIKKAFKIEVNGMGEQWIHLAYSDRPELVSLSDVKNNLFKEKDRAQAMAKQLRAKNEAKKAAEEKERAEKLKEVTEYLQHFDMWRIKNWRTEEIKPEGEKFAECIKRLYSHLPRKEKEGQDDYIRQLERYILHGTIETQGISFTKEHVVSIKYGSYDAVKIELTNGTTIIPKSEYVVKLLKLVFGNEAVWYYNDIEYPDGKHDEVEQQR